MKTFARLLALLLALLTVLLVVVACDDGGDPDADGDESSVIDDRYDINGRLNDDLPDSLNYEGETVTILHWNNPENPEFEQENVTGDNVRDAIYDRNNQIEDRLNVDIKFVGIPGHGNDRLNFVAHVEAIYQANTQDYDLIASYARTMGTLAVQGYLYNLATVQDNYIDLEKPWWPQQLVETVTFGNGSYYFVSGDMSTNVLYMMHMMYINKDLFSKYQLDVPYQDVYDSKWTLDRLIEITSDKYVDKDNDNTRSQNDQYGFGAVHWVLDSFFPGSNLRYVDEDENDWLVLSGDYTSAKAVKIVNKLGAWAATDTVWVYNQSSTIEGQGDHMNNFKAGNMLVLMQHSQYAGKNLLNVDFEYGLLPVPKYDEKQVNYYTGMGNPWSPYGIFLDFNDRGDKAATLSMLTAVLECWASEGYRLTTPEIFEVNMQLKYSAGQDETNMFEYIRSGITFDIGKIFAAELSNVCELPSFAIQNNASWSASSGAYRRAITAQLADIVESFQEYQAMRDQGQ